MSNCLNSVTYTSISLIRPTIEFTITEIRVQMIKMCSKIY